MENENIQPRDNEKYNKSPIERPRRYKQYDRINISIGTMDIIITALVIFLLTVFFGGILLK